MDKVIKINDVEYVEKEDNSYSYGNYHSYGNYSSYGNYYSDGNYNSDGNYHSDGNSSSFGNYYSCFNNKCKGVYISIFCKEKQGIANMVFNQQVSENKAVSIKKDILEILNGWLPYPTDYIERKKEGWHKEYKKTNKYVSLIKDYTYQKAWESCPKKKELIEYIKSIKEIDTQKALEVFTDITGIKDEQSLVGSEVEVKVNGKSYKAKIVDANDKLVKEVEDAKD